MDKNKINELKEKGYIKIRVIFEMLGKPKEHIEKTLKNYVEKVKSANGIEILSEDFAEAKQQDDGLWSTFAELEMFIKSLEVMTWLSVNFMPASIEILEPEKITHTNKQINFWINDVLAKLHEISLMVKGAVSKEKIMSKTLGTMMKNMVLLNLETGPKDIKELFKKTGIREDQLKSVLEYLVKKEKIVEKDGKYSRN
jgi:hypothetical protein